METTTRASTRPTGRLEGRVALVTGAASGIGAASAERLASEGAAVLVSDVQDEAGEAIAARIRAHSGQAAFVHHDVSEEADWASAVAAALDRFHRLDVLVNNAGFGDIATIEETSLRDYERTIAVDQTGVDERMDEMLPSSVP